VIACDTLRPPYFVDPTARAYKDWLHLIFADATSDTVGLVNVSLHGSPWDDCARAMGTVLLHNRETGWVSHVEILSYTEANLGSSSIGLRDVAIAVDQRNGAIHASVVGDASRFSARLMAEPVAPPLEVEREMPLGSGWISWYLVPNMRISGEWGIAGQRAICQSVAGYHDHNWGRWHWGDDFGWEWGCFLADPLRPEAPSLVFARTCDRRHRHYGDSFLLADLGGARRRFSANDVSVRLNGRFDGVVHRVPGAMAALHQEMTRPDLPAGVELVAIRGGDRVHISFKARAAAQFITADPVLRGYGFIHELIGSYSCFGRLGGNELEAKGYAVFEYVV
jgi:hypothetical protein